MKTFAIQTLLFCFLSSLLSCGAANLFNGSSRSSGTVQDLIQEGLGYQYRIRPDDKISLSIWGHDDLSIGSVFGIYNSNEVYGKWVMVDSAGFVKFPKIGKVALGNHTVAEAQKKLEGIYSKDVVDPIIVVKVLNREMTVLGEVKDAGSFLLEKEQNTLAEILGKAGGLNFYANPRKVKLVRKIGILPREYLIDLSKLSEQEMHSILVRSGDVVYVPTQKGKALDKKAPTIIPFTSLMTSLGILISVLR